MWDRRRGAVIVLRVAAVTPLASRDGGGGGGCCRRRDPLLCNHSLLLYRLAKAAVSVLFVQHPTGFHANVEAFLKTAFLTVFPRLRSHLEHSAHQKHSMLQQQVSVFLTGFAA